MMKIEAPINPNYAATVVTIRNLVTLEGLDNLVGIPIFGLQALVSKDTLAGSRGLLFPAECQLSDMYVRHNGLYRHAELNENPTRTGYLEDNRRVRAIKFRGHRSDALFMPFNSLVLPGVSYETVDAIAEAPDGTVFDHLDGIEICRKYERKVKVARGNMPAIKTEPRVDEKFFPQHIDSLHFFRVDRNIPEDAWCIVTQKLHGTSVRIGNVPVRKPLTFWQEVRSRLLGTRFPPTYGFDMVYGSRKVIKDVNNPNQAHFYGEDIWTDAGRRLDGLIPEGYIVYAELVGYTPGGGPIQSHFTYDQRPGSNELFVYRVAHVNQQGVVSDLSWNGVKQFCESIGVRHVPELWHGYVGRLTEVMYDDVTFLQNYFLDTRFFDGSTFDDPWREEPIRLSDPTLPDEGVCIRVEGMVPDIYKAKSPTFLQHETKLLDKDVADIEADQEVTV